MLLWHIRSRDWDVALHTRWVSQGERFTESCPEGGVWGRVWEPVEERNGRQGVATMIPLPFRCFPTWTLGEVQVLKNFSSSFLNCCSAAERQDRKRRNKARSIWFPFRLSRREERLLSHKVYLLVWWLLTSKWSAHRDAREREEGTTSSVQGTEQ